MLIEWDDLKLPRIERLLHVGGHLAEEAEIYKNRVGEVVWVEADAERAKAIERETGDTVICSVVGDVRRTVTFHEANNGQSSSVLEFGTHLTSHPEVKYISERQVEMYPLSELIESHNLGSFDMLNFDIQGAELLALQGMGDCLDDVKYIYTEVNKKHLYKGCCLIGELDRFLKDFRRSQVSWTPFGWGDAFYIRRSVES